MNRFVTYFKVWSAAFMLVAGVALSVAGFAVSPVGEIHDSVLWYFAQCLIYAGSAVGIDVIIDKRVRDHRIPNPLRIFVSLYLCIFCYFST